MDGSKHQPRPVRSKKRGAGEVRGEGKGRKRRGGQPGQCQWLQTAQEEDDGGRRLLLEDSKLQRWQ